MPGAPTATAIVAAMPEEMAPLRSRATEAKRMAGGRCEMVRARLHGRPVVLVVTGDGARNAREGVAALLAAARVERLIAIGVAGALSPDLAAGALVVSERVLVEGADGLDADAALVELAARHAGARRAAVVTAGRIIDTASEKQRLLRTVQPRTQAAVAGTATASASASASTAAAASVATETAVVDLESAAYAGAAARSAIPWVVLRVVSDTADEALPDLLNRCRDHGGAVRRAWVAFELMRDPGALPVLLSLRQRVRQGADVLARAVESMLVAPVARRAGPPPVAVSLVDRGIADGRGSL